ncbi:hypothetical protein ABG768_005177 [Culter alburnus]|uniref:Uncharacterized protein n=1 Tax=Culter alburnus TaxID=194366 RepID=A0AAW1ZRM2_CULAL
MDACLWFSLLEHDRELDLGDEDLMRDGVSSGASTSSGFQSCGFKSGFKIWQDLEQGLSMEVQDFALGMFMGATEEAAEHAKQDDMLTGLMGQQGV